MTAHAIVVAAGRGKRFRGLKQFYPLKGRPLLCYAMDNFEKHPRVKTISIVVPKEKIRYTRQLMKSQGYKKIKHIVPGGKRRQDSVLHALALLTDRSAIVIIHDGVRPYFSSRIITQGIRLCRKHNAVVFGIPIRDTVKFVHNHTIVRTVPRDNLYLIQTPQFFEIKTLRNAFKKADFTREYTDEAALLESLNIPVYLFRGDRYNTKVTDRSDFKLLEQIL